MKKKWYRVIDSIGFSLAILLFSYFFIAFGNIETTNVILKNLFSIFSVIGVYFKKAFPLFLALNYIGSRKRDIVPFIGTIICYIILNATTMIVSNTLYEISYYKDIFGIAISDTVMPLNLGILASLVIILIVEFSYTLSRKRYNYGILNFINNDVWFFLVSVVLSFSIGIAISYGYGYFVSVNNIIMNFISANNSNPAVMYVYGFMHKVFELLQIENVLDNNFLFGSLGGSWIDAKQATILGDAAIWTSQLIDGQLGITTGRYVTGFYIINIFAIPSLLIAHIYCFSDKIERRKKICLIVVALAMSLLTGSTVPVEYYLLFTAPMLLLIHYIICGIIFLVCQINGLYLGASIIGVSGQVCIGNLLEFIHYFKMVNLHEIVLKMIIIGSIVFVVYQILVYVYYRYMSQYFLDDEGCRIEVTHFIEALGGINNIKMITSSTRWITVVLYDKEKFNSKELLEDEAYNIRERYYGYVIYYGPGSYKITRKIRKEMKAYSECLKFRKNRG